MDKMFIANRITELLLKNECIGISNELGSG